MARTYDLDDDSVVVVIGSGAGGGVLASELARKGVDVVCLEAGPRVDLGDIVNDWGTMFTRLSWLDKRIGTGDLTPACRSGYARRSVGPRCTGPAPRSASSRTNGRR